MEGNRRACTPTGFSFHWIVMCDTSESDGFSLSNGNYSYLDARRRCNPLAHRPIAAMDNTNSVKPTKRPYVDSEPKSTVNPRSKRSKTPKACNACRKQKSRCEKLAGDSEGCHRCTVIGIPCVFESDGSVTDNAKIRKPRPILPRSRPVELSRT